MSFSPSGYLRLLCLPIAFFAAMMPAISDAQVAEDLQSHALFDIRLDKLREYTDAKGFDMNQMASSMTDGNLDADIVAKINRIYGSIQLPKDMATIQPLMEMIMMGPPGGHDMDSEKKFDEGFDDEGFDGSKSKDDGDVRSVSYRSGLHSAQFEFPINFFVRLEFTDSASADKFAESGIWPNDAPRIIEGTTYYGVSDPDGPVNLVWWKADETTIEIGTLAYVTQSTRRVFTDRLASIWGEMPDDAIRLAVDLESANTFVGEFTELLKQDLPPGAGPQLDLVNSLSSFRFSADLQADNLISVHFDGKDATATDGLQSALDQHVNMAKMMGGMAVSELSKASAKAGEAANQVIQELKLVRSDNQLSVVIPRPDGLDEAIADGIAAVGNRAAQVNRMNSLRQVALSVHNYMDANEEMPFHAKEGMSPDLSWRARVSLFVEGPQVDLKKAHDDPNNSDFADQMPESFGSDEKTTRIFWIDNGDGGPKKFFNISDGSSMTIMLIEGSDSIPWMKPGDLTVDEVITLFGSLQPGESILAAMYDGSTREIKAGIDEELLRKLLTYKGGEVIEFDAMNR